MEEAAPKTESTKEKMALFYHQRKHAFKFIMGPCRMQNFAFCSCSELELLPLNIEWRTSKIVAATLLSSAELLLSIVH